MTSPPPRYSIHTRLHRQGWAYSVVFHAMMAVCAVALMSGLTLSVEPNSYQWNVALIESPGPQPTAEPLPESRPEQLQKRQTVKPKSVPPEVMAKPVQQEVIPRQTTQPAQDVTESTTVNQTASTTITQTVEHHEVTQDRVVEEEPLPTKEVASNEPVTSAVEPVAQQPLVQTTSETPPQQPSAEQVVASATPFKAVPAAKADYGWLMRALLGRIDELKNYPVMARMNRWEGKVILRAVIRDDGQVLMVDVQESSGRSILDNDAMETLKKASPLKLDHPLGKPQVAILMPISYSLR